MREHAESLARQGFRVLPLHTPIFGTHDVMCSCRQADCASIGKHPRTMKGLTDATSDLDIVGEWWRMWPEANIGVATGYDFDVIDIDGEDGVSVYLRYCARFGTPAKWREVLTGRPDGTHVYVKPGGLKGWNGGFAGHPKGLDVKGKGGYVVAPPSLHESGRRYGWNDDFVQGDTPWPEWHRLVVADCAPVRIRQPVPTATSGIGFAGTVKERIYREVSGTPEGGRWQALQTIGTWGLAGLIKGDEIGFDEALTMLDELAAELGLTDAERRRLPDELHRAVENRVQEIRRREVPGTPGLPSSALSVDLSGPNLGLGGSNSELDEATRFRLDVEAQTRYYRVQMTARDAARDALRREALGERPEVVSFTLDELLALPDDPTRYRLEGLWPLGGRIMFAAQFKAGKTTMVGNVVRSLVDGSAFLNRYASTPLTGTIRLVDTEMSPGMLKSWLRDQAIANTERVRITPLRGLASSFEITDSIVRTQWAEELRKDDTEVFILDPLGPVLAALGLDENNNQDIGKFITAFEALLAEAEIADAMVVHHMGHFGERSRGASRLRDWPDVEWHLIRDGQEEEKADVAPDAPRFFRAFGRDVNVPEQLLHFDREFRWLSVNGDGSRKAVRESRTTSDVEAFVKANPGATQSTIEAAVRGKAAYIRSAIRELVGSNVIVVIDGPNKAKLHFHRDYDTRAGV